MFVLGTFLGFFSSLNLHSQPVRGLASQADYQCIECQAKGNTESDILDQSGIVALENLAAINTPKQVPLNELVSKLSPEEKKLIGELWLAGLKNGNWIWTDYLAALNYKSKIKALSLNGKLALLTKWSDFTYKKCDAPGKAKLSNFEAFAIVTTPAENPPAPYACMPASIKSISKTDSSVSSKNSDPINSMLIEMAGAMGLNANPELPALVIDSSNSTISKNAETTLIIRGQVFRANSKDLESYALVKTVEHRQKQQPRQRDQEQISLIRLEDSNPIVAVDRVNHKAIRLDTIDGGNIYGRGEGPVGLQESTQVRVVFPLKKGFSIYIGAGTENTKYISPQKTASVAVVTDSGVQYSRKGSKYDFRLELGIADRAQVTDVDAETTGSTFPDKSINAVNAGIRFEISRNPD